MRAFRYGSPPQLRRLPRRASSHPFPSFLSGPGAFAPGSPHLLTGSYEYAIEKEIIQMSAATVEVPSAILEPQMGDLGGTIVGPRNPSRERENPDILVPPQT